MPLCVSEGAEEKNEHVRNTDRGLEIKPNALLAELPLF
jgi:hypothetical protein